MGRLLLGSTFVLVLAVGGCRKPSQPSTPSPANENPRDNDDRRETTPTNRQPTQPNSPGAKRSHERVVVDAIATMRTYAASLNKVNDAASAEQAIPAVQSEAQKLQRLRQELASLGPCSADERARMHRHSDEIVSASQGAHQASAGAIRTIQAGQIPEDVADRVKRAAAGFGQAMVDFGQQLKPLLD
jgi:hypothetical protein